MALLDRATKITYGSTVLGGDGTGTDYAIVSNFELSLSHPRGSVAFDVLVQGDTRAVFVARETALKTAFTARDQKLTIDLGASERYDFDPADNTGHSAQPTAAKLGGDEDTELSALYRVGVGFGLPAGGSVAGRIGLQSAAVSVAYGIGRRRVITMTGVYTGASTNMARTQYEAQISTFATAMRTAIDSTVETAGRWKLVGEPQTAADVDSGGKDRLLRFSRAYEEELDVGMPSHAGLRGQTLDISVQERAASGGSSDSSAQPPLTVYASYRGGVDYTSTTDLQTMWTGTILPAIKTQISLLVGGYALMEATARYIHASNQIVGVVRARSYTSSGVISQRTTTSELLDYAREFVPIADGEEHTYRLYEGPRKRMLVINRETIRRASGGGVAGQGDVFGLGSNLFTVEDPGGIFGIQGDSEPEGLTSIAAPEGYYVLTESVRRRSVFEGIPGSQEELEGVVETVPMLFATVVEP